MKSSTTAVATKKGSANPQATDAFKKTISEYLEKRAMEDPLFAETLKKPIKNIDDCLTYIVNQVKASGMSGFEDSEIFGMAVHYYDEDNVKPGAAIKYEVIINRHVELAEEDIKQAKEKALEQILSEEKARLQKKNDQKKDKPTLTQESLF